MTIYGLEYRPAPYQPEPARRRLLPIVKLEFTTLFRSKWGVVLFVACLFSAIVRFVMLLLRMGVLGGGNMLPGRRPTRMPGELASLDPWAREFYLEPVVSEEGLVPLLILTALVTARAIAKDRSTNALELYWTRGISPAGYCVAKWLGSLLLVAMATAGAAIVLWVTGVAMAPDWTFCDDTIGFLPSVVGGLLVFVTVLTGLCILFSSVAGTPNLAAILWCILLVGSSAAAHMVADLTNERSYVSRLSVWDAAATVARAIAGLPERQASLPGALLLLGVVAGLLAWLARRRLRLQEAVG